LRKTGDLARQCLGFAQRLSRLDEAIGEPERIGLVCVDGASGENHIERTAVADEARQSHCSAVDERHAPASTEYAKDRRRRCDAQITPQCELETARNRMALDGGNDRFRYEHPCRPHWSLAFRFIRKSLRDGFEIGTGAKGRASSGKDGRERFAVGVEFGKSLAQQQSRWRINGIATGGAIDRNDRDRTILFDEHSLCASLAHVVYSLCLSRKRRLVTPDFVSSAHDCAEYRGLDAMSDDAHLRVMARARSKFEISPDILLRAYSIGLFPMAESAEDPNLFWVDPDARGIFPLDKIIISTSLSKCVKSNRFEVKVDHDFDGVIDGCAAAYEGREKTWINERIRTLYAELFEQGFVHTVECWHDGELVGGLYGVALGAAFFGESMFHRETNASKVALVHLAARLAAGGFKLLDTQFVTPHLATLGAIEVSKHAYRALLSEAVAAEADFWHWPRDRHAIGKEALIVLAQHAETPDPAH
jgi:leucyl/phenylalanyl-tRNA---protein transferase